MYVTPLDASVGSAVYQNYRRKKMPAHILASSESRP